MKTDGLGGLVWRFHQAPDGFEEGGDFFVVFAEAFFELEELEGELVLGAEQFAQLDEGGDDLNAGLDGDRAIEDAGEHDGAVFGEGVRAIARSSMLRS